MKKSTWIIIGIVIAIAAIGIFFWLQKKSQKNLIDTAMNPIKKFVTDAAKPRGIRNNNPGNIRISTNAWKGKVPKEQNSDGAFEQFYRMEDGSRAMIVLIRNWIKKGTANTIRKIISRYAPSNENNTQGYIDSVSKMTGFAPDQVLDIDKVTLNKLFLAMTTKENGQGHITQADFEKAWPLV